MSVNVLLAHMCILHDCYECFIEVTILGEESGHFMRRNQMLWFFLKFVCTQTNAIFIIYLQVNEQSFNLEEGI